MKLYKKNIAILMAGLLALSSGALVTSCDDDDDYDTNQFGGGVSLTAASLQVTRGAYMTFKGSNLNQITSVEFPGGVSSTPEVVDQYTIRALVPEDAEVGTVKLIYNGGELETKQIAFTEPIEFTSFKADADPILAGQSVKITGTYLNYISFVQFATGDNVEINNTNRTEFSVKVPIDASTGKFSIGYYSVDGTDTTEVLLESEEILNVVEPTSVKITNATIKAGETLNITGVNLQLVKSINIPGQDAVAVPQASDPFAAKTAISAKVADTATDGNVTLTLYSGLEINAGTYTTVLPTAAIKDAKASYTVGDTVVISGDNLDLVKTVAFTNDASASYDANLVGAELKVVVTTEAKSGDITLTLANGATVAVAGFVTTKPAFTFPTSVSPLQKLEIEATLADRIATISFGNIVVTPTVKDGKISLEVPLEAADQCAVTATMDNGEVITAVDALSVAGFTFCAFKDAAAFQAQTPTVGSLVSGVVVNGGNLDKVLLNGKETKFLVTGETLYVYTGSAVGEQVVSLVSGTDEAKYTINVIASGVVESVIWNGPLEITWNDGGRVAISASDLDVPAGSILRLYFNGKAGVWAQAQLNNGSWNNDLLGTLVPSDIADYDWWGTGAADEHVYEITLTSEVLAHLRANAGAFETMTDAALIIQGHDLIFSKVSVVVDYSAPKSIVNQTGTDAGGWTLPVALSWGDGGRLVVYKNNPVDLSSLVKVGNTLYIVTTNRHGQAQINDSSWSTIETVSDWGEDQSAYTFEVPITQAYVDAFNKDGDIWLIIQGDSGFTISDMYIK